MEKVTDIAEKIAGRITVGGIYFERMNDNVTAQLMNKIFPVKTGYWISRAFDKIRQESTGYFKEKAKLVEKHKDQKRLDDEKKKNPDMPQDQVFLKDFKAFQDDLLELQGVEIKLDIDKIKIDLDELEKYFTTNGEKGLTVRELEYLLPFFDIK